MAAGLFLGSGTAIAAPNPVVPVASMVSSGGGTGGEACAQLPAGLQDLLCPSAGGEGQGSPDSGGSASSAPTGGTSGTAATPGASGSGAPAQGGPVSNFLTWLAGLLQGIGL